MGLSMHTLFLMEDGTIKATGYNASGQLGIGNTDNQSTPQNVPLTEIKQIVSGSMHTMFLMKDGTVKACGNNNFGELGIGNTTNKSTIQNLPLTGVKQIACGNNHTVFLFQDGTVKSVGHGEFGQLGNGYTSIVQTSIQPINLVGVKQIACGAYHTIFLMEDGTVRSVGKNDYLQLGAGTMKNAETVIQTPPIGTVKQIVCGTNHTLFLLEDGTAKSIGRSAHGQLGNGSLDTVSTLQSVQLTGIKKIYAGTDCTFFMMSDGTIKSVGSNGFGQLANGETTVTQKTIQNLQLSNVKDIYCSLAYTVFLMNDGTVKSVGRNTYGELGIGNNVHQSIIQTISMDKVILLQESFLSAIKYLIQDGTSIKAYNNNAWTTLGQAPLVKSYLDQAMTSLSALTDVTLGQLTASSPELIAWYEEDEGAKTLTMNGPIWEEVATTLPSPEDMVLKGMPDLKTVPPEAWAELSGDFEVVTYTNDLDETQKLFLEALPKSQLIAGSTDFSEIAQMLLVASSGVKVVASSDGGVTWKALNNGVWGTVAYTTDAVKASGMSVASFNLITADQWKALGSAARFAYLLEGDALLDKITVTKVQITDATPSLDSMQVEYEELTLEGRLKDLELLNAINLAKLNFKANAFLLSDSYKLDDMIVDTFEKDSIVTTTSNLDETVEQAFTTPIAMGDGFYSEVVINQKQSLKTISDK